MVGPPPSSACTAPMPSGRFNSPFPPQSLSRVRVAASRRVTGSHRRLEPVQLPRLRSALGPQTNESSDRRLDRSPPLHRQARARPAATATARIPQRRRPEWTSADRARSGSGWLRCCRSAVCWRSPGAGGAPRARQSRRLSLPQMSRYYLTTPIYYVNSTPHIGHAYTTIAADILVRHQRQRGDETFFLTGTDENASKNVRAAEEAGVDPKTFVDDLVEDHWRPLPARVGASPDFFIRTTDEGHHRFVQEFVQQIYDNGHIYEDIYAGLYCVSCEEFKTEDQLTPDGLCLEHGTKPEWIEERNWFFRLSAFQEQLLRLYDERPDFVLPDFRYNEARSFIAGGLRDFSLSRAGQPWGVPVPWDPEQVVYVWVDALVNYLSALTYARPGEDLREEFWPVAHHLIGKDILRFHCVFWPALLLAAGYEVPRQIFVHGWLLFGDRKISKSSGNVIEPLELTEIYGIDALRFYAARVARFGQDGNASADDLHERYERELGNDLGNLVSRTTAMIVRYREGRIEPAAWDSPFRAELEQLARLVPARLDEYDLSGALEAIWVVIRSLNRYVEERAPWQLAKDATKSEELDRTLYDLADGLRAVAIALAAYLPETASRILVALGQSDDLAWEGVAYGRTAAAEGIAAAEPLFPRVELETAVA
ncbi:MAG: methionine--tRNA ligase [Actinobacteria bacterium]|nr:MAG: methionine--tRNA ligase [Actinomycetota bacterium]